MGLLQKVYDRNPGMREKSKNIMETFKHNGEFFKN